MDASRLDPVKIWLHRCQAGRFNRIGIDIGIIVGRNLAFERCRIGLGFSQIINDELDPLFGLFAQQRERAP